MPVIQSIVSKLITLLLLQIIMTISISTANAYSIGTPGQPWGVAEYKQWKDTRIKERCYHTNVVPAVQALSDRYDVIEYGQFQVTMIKIFHCLLLGVRNGVMISQMFLLQVVSMGMRR